MKNKEKITKEICQFLDDSLELEVSFEFLYDSGLNLFTFNAEDEHSDADESKLKVVLPVAVNGGGDCSWVTVAGSGGYDESNFLYKSDSRNRGYESFSIRACILFWARSNVSNVGFRILSAVCVRISISRLTSRGDPIATKSE